MRTQSRLLFTLPVLFCLPIAVQAEVTVANGGVQASPAQVQHFHSMEVRISGPDGEVFHTTSYGEWVEWSCNGCADGGYTVEARTAGKVGITETDEGPKPDLRVQDVASQQFVVQGGVLSLLATE